MAIEFNTEDKLEYQFHPVAGGIVSFKVRAAHDAHVALTSGPEESDPMLEIFLGGWKNTKSVIRKNRTKPDVVEVDTPDILNAGEFRGFWIRWTADGIITVGREGEAAAFMSWEDPDRVAFQFAGVCTGWGATGTWQIDGGAEIETADCLSYNFVALNGGSFTVEYKGPSNCHIGLMSVQAEDRPLTEIILGGWENQDSVIRVNRETPDRVRVSTPNLLNSNSFSKFHIQWLNGFLWVRKNDENGPVVLEGKDCVNFIVKYVAFRSGWGARGQWKVQLKDNSVTGSGIAKTTPPAISSRFDDNFAQREAAVGGAPVGGCHAGGNACWVPSSGGDIPEGAIVGGQDSEPLYVARAKFSGALIPGKLVPSHGVTYVAWSGAEHGVSEYEVLCGGGGQWVPTSGDAVPPTAIPAGETEEGEPLFVGRASHEGTLTIGKVQPSHGCVYIPYGGAELRYEQYEVLIV